MSNTSGRKKVLTSLEQERGKARDATHDHRGSQGPPSAPAVHRGPQEQVSRKLCCAREEEVEVLVPTQLRGVVGQPHIHAHVREPVEQSITNAIYVQKKCLGRN